MSAWLPEIFLALMGLAMLAYVVLDGFDLGVGILLPGGDDAQKDTMIASIGPFWDANETWLVLGVGILLIAFPMAHGVILSSLYLPVTLMLIALILRGVAFDFRVKARAKHKHLWDRSFFVGSALAALSQGFMLGAYILGFEWSVANFAFASFIGVCLLAGYALLGATWLLMKAEGELQRKAVRWAQRALWRSRWPRRWSARASSRSGSACRTSSCCCRSR
jgi:cytochrome d ubiquinol oxidase subunit II